MFSYYLAETRMNLLGQETMTDQERPHYQQLLARKVEVVNVGLEGFVKDLQDCGIEVVHVDWKPSAGGDPQMAALLAKLGV
ncbi:MULTISPECIES: hypothetical protein [unclassified Bradyrhizobium]|uniref:hypothetical protein n=1 Tax=unclassified Bradyrhizobium TaxID=2631580 RepID=UPI001FF977FD